MERSWTSSSASESSSTIRASKDTIVSVTHSRLIFHFAPEAFGSLRRFLEGECCGVLESHLVDPLGDFATLNFRVNGALLTLDFDH
jgi:hypothetical protein